MKLIPIALIALALIAGCAREPVVTQDSPVPAAPDAAEADTAAESLADLEARYLLAKSDYQLDGSLREEYIEATVSYATATMHGPGAPRQKYPQALELYSEALELDPENEEALKNREIILGIYEQMGRTPPSPLR